MSASVRVRPRPSASVRIRPRPSTSVRVRPRPSASAEYIKPFKPTNDQKVQANNYNS